MVSLSGFILERTARLVASNGALYFIYNGCYFCTCMEFLEVYGTDSESSDDGCDENVSHSATKGKEDLLTELKSSAVRQVYLVTYSQSNLDKFPTRKSFAEAVVCSFKETNSDVLHWACCRESHENGGYHYHLAIKLDKCKRWLPSKNYLKRRYDISVHFSNLHHNYYSAWKYVVKEDQEFLQSDNHPDLWNSKPPKTNAASSVKKVFTKRELPKTASSDDDTDDINSDIEGSVCEEDKRSSRNKRKKRLSAFDLSELIVQKGIKNRTELLAFANKQKMEGKFDVAEFIVNRGPRVVAEVLTTAWEMRTAQEKLDRSNKSRIEILEEAEQGECVTGCEGQWLSCALEVLQQNGICKETFTESIKELLDKGRSKFRNIMICGPANSAKTFILNPLTSVYNTFCNPACSSFAWVGAEDAECIFLNDFRWSQQVIQWHDFLLMLEGQIVHLPAPKTHYARDIVFDKDTPIFCTGKQPIIYIKSGVIDERETEMMAVRWKIFHFNVRIEERNQKEIPKCPKCFASLILN